MDGACCGGTSERDQYRKRRSKRRGVSASFDTHGNLPGQLDRARHNCRWENSRYSIAPRVRWSQSPESIFSLSPGDTGPTTGEIGEALISKILRYHFDEFTL